MARRFQGCKAGPLPCVGRHPLLVADAALAAVARPTLDTPAAALAVGAAAALGAATEAPAEAAAAAEATAAIGCRRRWRMMLCHGGGRGMRLSPRCVLPTPSRRGLRRRRRRGHLRPRLPTFVDRLKQRLCAPRRLHRSPGDAGGRPPSGVATCAAAVIQGHRRTARPPRLLCSVRVPAPGDGARVVRHHTGRLCGRRGVRLDATREVL